MSQPDYPLNINVKAVIFDMDGLMLDTERYGIETFRKAIADFGISVSDDIYNQTIGRNWVDSRKIYLDAMGEEFPFDAIRERWLKYNDEHITQHGVPCKPGLHTLLDRLDTHGLPKGVATSTSRQYAIPLLQRVGILDRFAAITTGDEVSNGKPHPEIFLLAAQRLNTPPEQCLVFEDSPNGIRAAHAAGTIPVLIPDVFVSPADVVKLAYRTYPSLDHACELFERTNSSK